VRLSRREAAERRALHETRLRERREELVGMGSDVVVVSTADPDDVRHRFLEWTEERRGMARFLQ
jgi:regulator of extracellular matrix RemA (YlzA/DUF370 family)